MRLIDADELLLRFIPRGGDNNFTRFVRETVRLRLAEMPTVELKPIVIDGEEYLTGADYNAYLKGYADGKAEPKHGRWIDRKSVV